MLLSLLILSFPSLSFKPSLCITCSVTAEITFTMLARRGNFQKGAHLKIYLSRKKANLIDNEMGSLPQSHFLCSLCLIFTCSQVIMPISTYHFHSQPLYCVFDFYPCACTWVLAQGPSSINQMSNLRKQSSKLLWFKDCVHSDAWLQKFLAMKGPGSESLSRGSIEKTKSQKNDIILPMQLE